MIEDTKIENQTPPVVPPVAVKPVVEKVTMEDKVAALEAALANVRQHFPGIL